MGIIVNNTPASSGGGGGGGGSGLPTATDAGQYPRSTGAGTTYEAADFGDSFAAVVEAHGDDIAGLIFPAAAQAGWVPMSTGAGRSYTAQPLPIAAPEGAQTNDATTPQNTKWLNLSASRIYRLRITAVGADASRSNSIVIVREAVIRTDGTGAFAVTNHDLVIDPDGGWTAPVAGVSPHLVIVDLGGAAGQVCVVGIDSTTINWSVVVEQLG